MKAEDTPGFGLYVHIPFCPQHCPYCAFAVVTGHRDHYDRYVNAVCRELELWQDWKRQQPDCGPLHTIYFGGGTPSMLSPAQLGRILATARRLFGICFDAEITLEANPSNAESSRLQAFRDLGFNRLSLGVQAFHDDDLKVLGRLHRAGEAQSAFETARTAGFANIGLDLMGSVPGISRDHWRRSVRQALALRPEHLSAYSLTIEEGTHFAERAQQGRLPPVSEDDDVWAFRWTQDTLETAGYEHYEVSNYARPGFRSRHNWGYWHGMAYIGVGQSAHSYVEGRRQWNARDLQTYLARIDAGQWPTTGSERIDAQTAWQERIALQLRTCDGVRFTAEHLHTLQQSAKFQGLSQSALVVLDSPYLKLTREGMILADQIAVELIDLLAL